MKERKFENPLLEKQWEVVVLPPTTAEDEEAVEEEALMEESAAVIVVGNPTENHIIEFNVVDALAEFKKDRKKYYDWQSTFDKEYGEKQKKFSSISCFLGLALGVVICLIIYYNSSSKIKGNWLTYLITGLLSVGICLSIGSWICKVLYYKSNPYWFDRYQERERERQKI